jgi:hypothetical protein
LLCNAFASEKEKHVEKKHYAKINAKSTDFITQAFDEFLDVRLVKAYFENVERKSKIHQIESDAKEIICRMGNLWPSGKDIIHVDDAIFE